KTFSRLLDKNEELILSNVLLSGLRGVGKTVLLDKWKPVAISKKWLWVGTDLSESTSVSERTMVTRLLADLSVITSGIVVSQPLPNVGFSPSPVKQERINYDKLIQ